MLATDTQHQQQQQPLKLTPEVLDRLRHLQQVDRPVSVDEVLHAANLDHLAQFPQPSKSSTAVDMSSPLPEAQAFPRKSRSTTTTLAERRRIPASTEKLKLYCQITQPTTCSTPSMTNDTSTTTDSSTTTTPITTTTTDNDNTSASNNPTLERLEMENAQLSPQASEDYLLARLERQNALLSADPKSVCIESNKLKTDFDTVRNLVQQGDHDNNNNDWEFWEYLVQDFTGAATKLPHLLVAKLSHGGIPDRLRGVVWRAMSQSSATHLESIYDKLVLEHSPSLSPYERVIQRDLSRTFPQVDMFKTDGGEGQQAMGRLLRAYSVYDAHVGYCQGLAFLVGPLLMTMPEKDAFCVFVRLMETYDMRTMFTLNMEGLHLRLHQFSVLLAQLCPELSAHLNEHSVHPAMYASQWFLTLFAYSFPIDLVLRIYDLVFAEGAIETITRVAVAVMQKNQDKLMQINDFEKLMMYLSSRRPYEEGFSSDPETVIGDAMALSNVITRSKVDSIAAQHRKELEQEKSRAQQVLAIRFDQSAAAAVKANNNKSTKNKRESWFSWASASQNRAVVVEQPASPVTSPTSPTFAATTGRASTSSINSSTGAAGQQMLHQQIEDLVLALSQLQKEHSQLSEEMMALKMRDMDRESERQQLAKRNQALEKRIRKYKSKLNASTSSANTMAALASPSHEDSNATRLEQLEHDPEFNSFVDSLRMSGDFGALIAGALDSTTQPKKQLEEEDEENDQQQQQQDDSNSMTNELVAVKLLNIQLREKYNDLNEKHEQLSRQLESARDAQRELLNKQAELQAEVETLGMTREQLLEEHEAIEEENHEMEEKLMAAKKTCSELQVEKLALAKQVEQLERRIAQLEQEKQEYLMPRGSFTEEVFAAHQTLFGTNDKKEQVDQQQQQSDSEYQKKYVESELRCRELEKLLAETKCKLAEYESCPSSPRLSHPPPSRRRSMRNSMLSAGSRMSLPPTCEPGRVSTDSITSCGSGISSKRSSMYSRLFGNTTPSGGANNGNKGNAPTPITNANLVEEPQHL